MSFGFNKKTDYALLALAKLAAQSADNSQPIGARSLAADAGLPEPTIMQVFKALQQAGLVSSRRGPTGGYVMARSADRITVAQVVAAIEGKPSVLPCCDEQDAQPCTACARQSHCPITGTIHRLNDLLTGIMRHVTIDDLLHDRLPGSLIPLTASITPASELTLHRQPPETLGTDPTTAAQPHVQPEALA